MLTMRPRVLFYVQHLLGIGHIKRASLLVQGWVEAGLDVTVVSGGEPVAQFCFDGVRLIQLPPVKASDANFSSLVNDRGLALDDAFKQRRIAVLLEALQCTRPQLLVIENYPFGRRQLRWELRPLLAQAAQLQLPPIIVCSVRDILQARSAQRIDETVALIERYFDAILVHGDADFIPLQQSFPRCDAIADKLYYTGYVSEAQVTTASPGGRSTAATSVAEVLVSAGGGAVGFALMQACLQALAQPQLFGTTQAQQHSQSQSAAKSCWRFLLGPNVTAEQQRQLKALAQQIDRSRVELVIEPVRPDFSRLLQRCRLSISQGGYNTLMDLLSAGCAAVVVPFEGDGETEQLTRTERLAQLGFCQMLREAELDPARLARAVNAALNSRVPLNGPERLHLDCQGVARSAQILLQLVATDG